MSTKPPVHLATDRNPWDRQPGESHKQYARFQAFLELGRTRTLTQAAEMLHGLGDTITYGTLRNYAHELRWTERAEAHDRDQDRLERVRLLQLRREMYARHRKLAGGLTAKAVKRLTDLKPEDLTPLDIVRFFRVAAELERASLGEPDKWISVSGPGGGPIAVDDFSQYTPAERRARMEQLAAEIGRRAALHDDDEDDGDDG
jgi:hypothetical protein